MVPRDGEADICLPSSSQPSPVLRGTPFVNRSAEILSLRSPQKEAAREPIEVKDQQCLSMLHNTLVFSPQQPPDKGSFVTLPNKAELVLRKEASCPQPCHTVPIPELEWGLGVFTEPHWPSGMTRDLRLFLSLLKGG